MYDRLHGPARQPLSYELDDYVSQITSSPVNTAATGNWDLTPLEDEDMARYAHDDVVDAYKKMHQDKSPTALGEPLDDEGMKKYTGMTTEWVITEDKKPWRAKRQEIIDLWTKLRPYLPINAEPIPTHHEGTRYRYDGLRITGKPSFINAILSRLKEFLRYDNYPGLKLDIEYEQIASKEHTLKEGPRFVCYIHVVEEPRKPL